MLANITKMLVCRTYVLSTLFYVGEEWTLYTLGENADLNIFHMRYLRRIFGI